MADDESNTGPMNLQQRIERRKFYVDRAVERAMLEAAARQRSLGCTDGTRHEYCIGNREPDCCLCECHDAAVSS